VRITVGGSRVKLVYKIWLDQNGKAFGDGPLELLRRVGNTLSLHEAANQMGMSYSKAWRLIRTLEQRLGFPLLDRKVGGISGGGSRLTDEARHFMGRYSQFREEVNNALDRIYAKHFRQGFPSSLAARRKVLRIRK
jgi:molybdate transport system regulatory protein